MTAACNLVNGSNIKISLTPNIGCQAAPTVQTVSLGAAVAVGATSIQLLLNPANVPAYTATSAYPLLSGTVLTFSGGLQVKVQDASDGTNVYVLTTTAQSVNVELVQTAIPATAIASTFFGLQLCVSSVGLTTNTNTVDSTTNCTGSLYTSVSTGFTKELALMGYLASKDFAYEVIRSRGYDLGTFFFAVDFDGKFYLEGQVQLTDFSLTQLEVKQIAKFENRGQIQQIDFQAGSFVKDAAALTLLNQKRALYGFASAKDVTVNALAA
jgi:hypothetical protein